jgi:hypothetical protein
MSELTQCPNCNAELKSGLLSSNKLLESGKVEIINEYYDQKNEGYCSKCGNELFEEYNSKLKDEISDLSDRLQELLPVVPIVSTHTPQNWDYQLLEMVTGQSTTGTGVVSEFVSSFTDFFGTQSGMYNDKLSKGEKLCMAQIRKKALDL